jgi:hypothetical protein
LLLHSVQEPLRRILGLPEVALRNHIALPYNTCSYLYMENKYEFFSIILDVTGGFNSPFTQICDGVFGPALLDLGVIYPWSCLVVEVGRFAAQTLRSQKNSFFWRSRQSSLFTQEPIHVAIPGSLSPCPCGFASS